MKRTHKRNHAFKILVLMVLLIFLFSIFKIGITLASTDPFTIINAEILDKSDGVNVSNFNYENNQITANVEFHNVGDSIRYQVTIRNNDNENYTIRAFEDDNNNEYVSYIYDNHAGTIFSSKGELTLDITERYIKEVQDPLNRKQKIEFRFTASLEDEEGNVVKKEIAVKSSSNPKTLDNIGTYVTTLIASFIVLIILIKMKGFEFIKLDFTGNNHSKNKSIEDYYKIDDEINEVHKTRSSRKRRKRSSYKLFSILIFTVLVLPTAAKAIENNSSLLVLFDSNVALYDKMLVNYVIDDISYSLEVKYNDYIVELCDAELEGYTFKGWKKDDGTKFDITKPVTEDITIIAQFEAIDYKIEYNGLTEAEINALKNPKSYNIETEDIELKNPSRVGYIFEGWSGENLNGIIKDYTIEKGTTGDIELTANWKLDKYSIDYDLDGGIDPYNPTQYDIEADDITLTEPTREGYEFLGWTGTGLTDVTKNVTINSGSTGKREYKANWEIIYYDIQYEGLKTGMTLDNPTRYTIEMLGTELLNPEDIKDQDGDITEKFLGWKIDNTVSLNTIISGDLENKTYTAIWQTIEPDKYSITYDLDGGILEEENLIEYTKYTEDFELNNPKRRGYAFKGWTGSNGTTPQIDVTVDTATRANLTYTANWLEEKYYITYTGIINDISLNNITEYTVNSDDITLNRPTKDGYTFIGWTGTDLEDYTLDVVIPKNSIGNRSYRANFEANEYEIVFNKNGGSGSMANQKMTYDKTDLLNQNEFKNSGYAFNGWNTKDDGSGKSYSDNQEVTNLCKQGEITLYAQWRESTKAELMYGSKINAKLKQLAGDSDTSLEADNTSITKIVRASSIDDSNKTENNRISNNISGYLPVYAWFDNGIIYYYSEAEEIYLHSDSKGIFNCLLNLESIDMQFNTSNVKNMSRMFFKCHSLESIDLSNFDTSNVENMTSMFSECMALKSIDLKSFNTENVTTFNLMFNQCYGLTEIDLSYLNTSNCTNFSKMFSSAENIKKLDLSTFDTRNATTMEKMFSNMYSVESIDFGGTESLYKTSNVKKMNMMFFNCYSLKSLDLTGFDTSKVTLMDSMFEIEEAYGESTKLETLDLSSFNTSMVTGMTRMFAHQRNLKTIYVSQYYTVENVNTGYKMFVCAYSLEGGKHTKYNNAKTAKEYANIDDPDNGHPGYFTDINDKP